MTNDISQTSLKEPERCDWDNAFKGSTYTPPPPALGADGKPIVYFGQVATLTQADAAEGYLNYQIDLKFTRAGEHDGKQIRTWASTKPWMKKGSTTEFQTGNPNALAKFLQAAGLQIKPQSNSEYEAALKMVNGKAIPFTLDWEAKNKDTGEVVRGFNSFPEDVTNPGTRKSILRRGDTYNLIDAKGSIIGTDVVQSEVLFANPRLRYFQNPTPKVGK